jgi:hypothetical protein
MEPSDKVPVWKDEDAYQRVLACRYMLLAHDFLTEAEGQRVAQRIRKWANAYMQGAEEQKEGKHENKILPM